MMTPKMSLIMSVAALVMLLSGCTEESLSGVSGVRAGDAGGAAGSGQPERPNVLLVCIDTLRADHLGCYGYERRSTSPNLDRLATESIVFASASSTAGWTKPSVPSFLTGTYPLQHGVYEGSSEARAGKTSHVLAPEALTLAEVFSAAGWRTGAFVKNAQLNRGNGFEQGFEVYRDRAGDARDIRWAALDWIDGLGDGEAFFLYLHFLDAHWPYPVPDEVALRFVDEAGLKSFREEDWRAVRDAINDGERVPSESELELLLGLYDAGIRYVDDELGRLFEGLELRGLERNTVICVISDHGEEFMEHGRIGHGHGLYETLLQVPWILRVPGRDAERSSIPVSLVDLFPTLTAAAGMNGVADGLPGIDRLAHPGRKQPRFAEHKEPAAYQQSLAAGSDKLIRRFVPELSGGEEELPAVGGRWEVELRGAEASGDWVARTIKLRDEPADDPFEVKDHIEGRTPAGFRLCGLQVELRADTELYGEVPQLVSTDWLEDGWPVKVQGAVRVAPDGSLRLAAERIKVYARDARIDRELRGPLTALEGEFPHRAAMLGPVRVVCDSGTRWDLSLLRERGPRLSREALLELVVNEERMGVELERRCFSLEHDPREQHPSSEGCVALDGELDRLGAALVGTGEHGGERLLEEDVLEELRELGYLR